MAGTSEKVRIAENGRLVLPKAIREAAGIVGETRVSISVEDGEIRLTPASRSVTRAQALYRKHARKDISSEEFVASRDQD